jgi:hypothetical protein
MSETAIRQWQTVQTPLAESTFPREFEMELIAAD